MWPWGHLAVGYLSYVGLLDRRDEGEQTAATLLAVAFGSQVPDLVDKPLAWSLAVLPSGRSLAHSLLVAAVVLGAAYWVARGRRGRVEAVVALAVGWVSHSLVDLGPEVVGGLLQGDWSQLEWTTYLLWPVLPSPPYPNDESFAEHFVAFEFDPYMLVQFGLLGIAIGVWVASGTPGVGKARGVVARRHGGRE